MSSDRPDALSLAEAIDRELCDRGTCDRAAREKAYLKSSLEHYGVSVPDTRAVVRRTLSAAELDHDGAIALASQLWTGPSHSSDEDTFDGPKPVHERRSAATMVLIQRKDHLGAGDAGFVEVLLRQSRTWALVDPLAGELVGPLSDHDAEFDPVLERWARDEDFWIRRSALLAHLRPLRKGRGDFDRFSRFADAMLEEKEFFIRKAIGWVLRDTARTRPDMVFDWMLPRAHRASGVTLREVVKHLSPKQRNELLAAKGTWRIRAGAD